MRRYLLLLLSLSTVLLLNIYFRIFPVNFPQLKSEAKAKIEDKINKDITKEIDKNFPDFKILAKKKLITGSISEYKKNNKPAIKSEIQQEYLKLKDRYQDPNGQTYLMELDCWHWARYVENVYRLGRPGDEVVNGKQIDTLMFAPHGSPIPWNQLLFYLSAWLYKIFSIIKHLSLFTFLFYLPLFFATFFLIILYLLCYHRWGNLCAAIACLFVGLTPIFLFRSCVGWFDMDVFNLLFPLLICWAYAKTYGKQVYKTRVLWLCLAGFWLGLFSFTWPHWWFILLIIVLYEIYSLAISVLFHYLRKDDNLILLRRHLSGMLLFLTFSLFWVLIYSGIEPLKALYSQVRGVFVLNSPMAVSIWPNVLSTVGELTKLDPMGIINFIGVLPFILSFCCLSMLFLRTFYNPEFAGFESEFISILFFWFTSMFFACSKGTRFTMFLLVPLGISLGWVTAEAYHYFKKKRSRLSFVILISAVLLGVQFLCKASAAAKAIFPMMNDARYRTLFAINQKSPKNTVINSWWDFGDWFKAVSHRKVIIDGAIQNVPQTYWMASVFLSNNEKEALRILRMLNNGGNRAFEIIKHRIKDPFCSILLLKRVLASNLPQAKEALLKFLPPKETEEVLRLVFGDPGNAYFVVDDTMVKKMPAISFLGNWDFVKFYISQNLKGKEKAKALDYLMKLGVDKQQIEKFYQEAELISPEKLYIWVSNRAKFYSGLLNGQQKDNTILFDNGIVYYPKEKTVYLYSSQRGIYEVPKSLFLFNENKMEETTYPNKDLDYSALIFKNSDGYQAILLDRELGNSLFLHLYFLRGGSFVHFKPFIEGKDGKDYIRVFEIIWGKEYHKIDNKREGRGRPPKAKN